MRIVCISDTHLQHDRLVLPDGDVLIHSGDFSTRGTIEQIVPFMAWLKEQPHKHKLLVAGNHDWLFERNPNLAYSLVPENVIYLQDERVVIDDVKFYGSPWTPLFYDWAFMRAPGKLMADKWRVIPEDTEVLITHGPPKGILDPGHNGTNAGCADLLARIPHLTDLKLHVFGHLHSGAGEAEIAGVHFVNAASCDDMYNPVFPPIVVDL